MREVIPQVLWLGNARDARDLTTVLSAGITALVDLAEEELPPPLVRDVIYCRFPLIDGEGNAKQRLQMAVRTLAAFIREKHPTLVYCGAGMSRAPAIAAAALAQAHGESPQKCLEQLTASAAHDVSPLLWRDITAACS